MKIKKLSITGFKSFAEKASIQFPSGISAIVGPNGCGKSNIVDALKWAMGEQSIKQLRGKKREDIIFAGANNISAMNMAEVSIVLVNDNGSMPGELKEFSEVMLTRRLYRSGESVYLLNKQPCRLKDFHNVFMGSGLGAKSYAVIQQGNIGAVTDAGPEERRAFIEEAAGVTRYKVRKMEAIRKMEDTRRNLLRLNDIIKEVEQRMAGLKRQAKRAELFKTFRKKIRELDISISLHRHRELSARLQETEKKLRELKDSEIEQNSKYRGVEALIQNVDIEKKKKEQEIEEQRAELQKLERSADRVENDLSHLREEVERLGNEITELQLARQNIEEKNGKTDEEIKNTETELNQLKNRLAEIESSMKSENEISGNQAEKIARKKGLIETLREKQMETVAKEAEIQGMIRSFEENKEELQRNLRRIDEEEALLKRDVEACLEKEKQAKKNLEELKLDIRDIDEEIENSGKMIEDRKIELKELETCIRENEIELEKVRSEYKALRKMEDNYDGYRDGVKDAMKNLDRKEFGIAGLLSDFIEPEASWETAVEAVLGDALQFVMVRDQDAAGRAIGYLEENDGGRCGFVPVSVFPSESKIPNDGQEAYDSLLNHVSVKTGGEQVVTALLSRAFVANDLKEALRRFNGNGKDKTFITPRGEVVTSQGVVIGGGKKGLFGILEKKTEMKELMLLADAIEQKLTHEMEKRQTLEENLQKSESALKKTLDEKKELDQEIHEAEKHLIQISGESAEVSRRLQNVKSEQERLLDAEDHLDIDFRKNSDDLLRVRKEIKGIDEALERENLEFENISREMESFEKRVTSLRIDHSTLETQVENSLKNLKRLNDYRSEGRKRLEALASDILIKKEKLSLASRKIANSEKNLANWYKEIEILKKELEKNREDHLKLQEQLKKQGETITEIRNQRETIIEKIRVLELDRSQMNIKCEAIAEQLLERYHKPMAELSIELGDEAGGSRQTIMEMEADLETFRKKMRNLGDVNLAAIKEYEEQTERFNFLSGQREDLEKAMDDLMKVIRKINQITQERFLSTFNEINKKIGEVFPKLFNGGSARLELTEPSKPLETGVEFMVHPPGKKLSRLSLLSGGEKALSAIAFVFSIFLIKPASFCIMDEIDAPLDEANVYRFNELLKIIGENSQIIMITHKKKSMEFADTLFGVTMEKKGVSKIVSVNLNGGDQQENGV